MFSYRISGLNVASEVAFGGTIAASAVDMVDVHVRQGSVPDALDQPTHSGPNWQIAGDRLLLEVPGVVRMLVTAGGEILFETLEGTTPDDAAIFLSGTGMGMILHQRGLLVLHASAVRVGEKAVLFCGASGAGKSTIAAALGEAGYDLVADDFAAISLRDGVAFVEPDGRQHKLWQQAIERLDLGGRNAGAVRSNLSKFYVEPSRATDGALPIGGIFQLREARPPHVAGIERPNIVDAGLILRRNAYRPAMVKRLNQQQLYFAGAATLISAGVYTLTRPLGFQHLPVAVGWLEGHWAGTGLTKYVQ